MNAQTIMWKIIAILLFILSAVLLVDFVVQVEGKYPVWLDILLGIIFLAGMVVGAIIILFFNKLGK